MVNKKFKKIISVVILSILTISVVGCGKNTITTSTSIEATSENEQKMIGLELSEIKEEESAKNVEVEEEVLENDENEVFGEIASEPFKYTREVLAKSIQNKRIEVATNKNGIDAEIIIDSDDRYQFEQFFIGSGDFTIKLAICSDDTYLYTENDGVWYKTLKTEEAKSVGFNVDADYQDIFADENVEIEYAGQEEFEDVLYDAIKIILAEENGTVYCNIKTHEVEKIVMQLEEQPAIINFVEKQKIEIPEDAIEVNEEEYDAIIFSKMFGMLFNNSEINLTEGFNFGGEELEFEEELNFDE